MNLPPYNSRFLTLVISTIVDITSTPVSIQKNEEEEEEEEEEEKGQVFNPFLRVFIAREIDGPGTWDGRLRVLGFYELQIK